MEKDDLIIIFETNYVSQSVVRENGKIHVSSKKHMIQLHYNIEHKDFNYIHDIFINGNATPTWQEKLNVNPYEQLEKIREKMGINFPLEPYHAFIEKIYFDNNLTHLNQTTLKHKI